jgi:GntR family transcriptional regulator/MocR family aminotransferase
VLTNRTTHRSPDRAAKSDPFRLSIKVKAEMINFDSLQQSFDSMSRPIQIYKELRKKIVSEELKPGSKLPSRTELCKHYNVSKATVHRAFELLLSDGYIQTFVGTGAFVRGGIQRKETTATIIGAGMQALPIWLSTHGQNISQVDDMSPSGGEFVRELGVPVSQHAWTYWKRASYQAIEELTSKGDIATTENEKTLRTEIAQRLAETRAVSCRPRQVFILPSREAAVDLITRLHVNAGETVAYQDPAVFPIETTLLNSGVNVLELPAELSDEKLNSISADTWQDIRMLYLTPSCAMPTGSTIPFKTRVDLLNMAISHNKLIVEDDYFVEFSDSGLSTKSLQGIAADCGAPVIYLGSLDTVFSGISSAVFLVVPPELSGLYRKAVNQLGLQVSAMEILVLSRLLASGDFEKLAIRTRADAQHRHSAMVALIEKQLAKPIFEKPHILGASLNVVINNEDSESALRELCSRLNLTPVETILSSGADNMYQRKKFRIIYSNIDLKLLLEMAVRLTSAPEPAPLPVQNPVQNQAPSFVAAPVQNAFAI